jgi:ABC-type sugar transport system substrate-binding protein
MKWPFRLLDRRQTLAAATGSWRGSHQSWVLLVFCGILLSFGCESSSFAPPPADGRDDDIDALAAASPATSPGLEAESAGARSIELLMDRRNSEDAELVRAAARMQAGQVKVRLKVSILKEQDLPAQQTELVREAVARLPLALIVEPSDPTDRHLAELLQKARGEGVPIVLLNRPLASGRHAGSAPESPNAPKAGAPGQATAETPASQAEQPMVLVAPPSFDASAHQLVASAARNAMTAKLDPKSGAIIVVNTVGDPFLRDRTDALRSALKAFGVTTVVEIPFTQKYEVASKLLSQRLKADSKLTLVFSIDSLSSTATRNTMTELGPERPFILAGYAADDNFADYTKIADFAAMAIFAPTRLVRKAIDTAVALAERKAVPSRVEVPIVVHDSAENSGLPQSPTYKSKMVPSSTKPR